MVARVKVELIPLSKLVGLPRNAKDHDLGAIVASIRRFGFLDPILLNGVTGHVLAGHGRRDGLRAMKVSGEPPPPGVEVNGGEWMVPVVQLSIPAEREEAAAVALNRTVELGGWDEAALVQVLSDLAAAGELEGTGYTAEELDSLLRTVIDFDPQHEWQGMPEFEQDEEQSYDSIKVHFRNEQDRAEFMGVMGEKPDRVKSIWYPKMEYLKQST